jgi:hypothetical protein
MPEILVLSKTQMKSKFCVGGITMDGRYVRLMDNYGNYQPGDTPFLPRQIWDITFVESKGCKPPHIEDVLVTKKEFKKDLNDEIRIKDFIDERNIPIWKGSPDQLFDKLLRWTANGSGYISESGGLPGHSVGFWISDKNLSREPGYNNKTRYGYPNPAKFRSMAYTGAEKSIKQIPAGTLIRVSLAKWMSRPGDDEPKCWLQLSGWYDLQ